MARTTESKRGAKKTAASGKNSTDMLDERPVLLLNGSGDKVSEACKYLDAKYTKEGVVRIAACIRKVFGKYCIRDKADPSKSIKCLDVFFFNPKLKEDYIWPVAVVMGDDDNFKEFFSRIPDNIKRVWELCYRKMYANVDEANALAEETVVVKKKGFWRAEYDVDCVYMPFFNVSDYYYHHYGNVRPYIWMNSFIWNIYNRCIADNRACPLDELKTDASTLFYSNEAGLGEQLYLLRQMQKQGMLEFGERKMGVATIKKAVQQTGLEEFYPDANDKKLKLSAAQLMIPSLASLDVVEYEGNFNYYWEFMRYAIGHLDVYYIGMEWLSHIKGIKRDELFSGCHLDDCIENISNTLRRMESGRWLSFADFDKRRRCNENVGPDEIEGVSAYFINGEKQTFAVSEQRLSVDDLYENITIPICKGCLFLFATYGLLEIAYHVPSVTEPTYAGLDYIRLTKLGEYVFGQSDKYEHPGIVLPTEYFEIDDERLIIRALQIDGKNPYEPMVKNVAEPIGAHRYRVTVGAFMNGCENPEDVNRKWKWITENVCEKPSAVWQDFYAEMNRHCLPLVNTGIGYTLKKIRSDNTELMRIMTTDKYIREHIIRAECNHVLIETKCMEKVKEALRKYGYIV